MGDLCEVHTVFFASWYDHNSRTIYRAIPTAWHKVLHLFLWITTDKMIVLKKNQGQ